jgi:putative hydrolase of the HAD superfamily
MTLARIEAVLFDAVGTVIHARQPIAATYFELGRRHGCELSESEVAERFRHACTRQDAIDCDELGWKTDEARELRRWRQIVNDVFSDVGPQSKREALFDDLWSCFANSDTWTVYNDVQRTIPPLIERGLTIGLVSNFDERLDSIVSKLPPLELCEHVFVSSRLGFRKPSADFFRAVASQLGIDRERLLMVGDDPVNDYDGARNAGWNAVLIDRTGNDSNRATIAKLDELLAMLAK